MTQDPGSLTILMRSLLNEDPDYLAVLVASALRVCGRDYVLIALSEHEIQVRVGTRVVARFPVDPRCFAGATATAREHVERELNQASRSIAETEAEFLRWQRAGSADEKVRP
jgi:hypothetical protein